ncbi:hypothetical protein Y032_0132g1739 [Ancylostoma ceylanicum]|uniref:Uncharacterized protein n=1 Tax=Ancylostoma ceylanicum TaxID=53326 RepID=A0A016T6T7_9BILA|nr:hypothetical protein Y032_0132g1739 [Ancylostoma ceylanicum]
MPLNNYLQITQYRLHSTGMALKYIIEAVDIKNDTTRLRIMQDLQKHICHAELVFQCITVHIHIASYRIKQSIMRPS